MLEIKLDNPMNKDELLKIALSRGITRRSYDDSFGANEAEKFINAFGLKPKVGKKIPVLVVYYFYYLWAKKPINFRKFSNLFNKYVKSYSFYDTTIRVNYRCYKLDNFPEYNAEDELKARRLRDGQKEKSKRKRQRKEERTALRKKESGTESPPGTT